MPTYVYETIPTQSGVEPQTFEVRQSMRDPALTHHPETGEPVRRVILGGYGVIGAGKGERASAPVPVPAATSRGRACGLGCGCHPAH
jgi:predicted nucleic acid-binding Zn ribbon protein